MRLRPKLQARVDAFVFFGLCAVLGAVLTISGIAKGSPILIAGGVAECAGACLLIFRAATLPDERITPGGLNRWHRVSIALLIALFALIANGGPSSLARPVMLGWLVSAALGYRLRRKRGANARLTDQKLEPPPSDADGAQVQDR